MANEITTTTTGAGPTGSPGVPAGAAAVHHGVDRGGNRGGNQGRQQHGQHRTLRPGERLTAAVDSLTNTRFAW